MKTTFRSACSTISRSLNPNPPSLSALHGPRSTVVAPLLRSFRSRCTTRAPPFRVLSSVTHCSSAMSGGEAPALPLEKQFEDFRSQLEDSVSLRERIRLVVMEIESTTRLMYSSLLLVYLSRPLPEVLDKAKAHIGTLKDQYSQLAAILRECPDQYYRYHGDWRSETQTAVCHLAFAHYLETGNLLLHNEAGEKLGLNNSQFGLDIEDYLVGVCFMSNELPRYVVNQVTAGDYDCPRKVWKFLTELNAAFRMLNLRNDFLRKKFDGSLSLPPSLPLHRHAHIEAHIHHTCTNNA
ncbi:translin isoform X2 [Rhodamnia argentea]|uniref:Translin isoform X2 n=1 Tax=Rhodamnia argentea TaxID=178133 RepID=A0ABM3GT95_9MYRT|nr:translin isoform X2 [Rhodamnia argentea]